MALKVKNGALRLDDVDEDIGQMSRTQTFVRRAIAHLATASLTAVLVGGLSLEDKTAALQDAKDTFENLAVYSGCATRDKLRHFYWIHMLTDPQEDQGAPAQPKRVAKRRSVDAGTRQ